MDELRVNELDLTRAGIISVQKYLPNERTHWQVDFEIGSTLYRINADASNGQPHGTDGDVLLALQTLFFRAGCPASNEVTFYPSELLRLTTLDDGGKSYTRLREALLRLGGVRWSMVKRHFEQKESRYAGTTAMMSLIAELRLVDYTNSAKQPFASAQIDERIPIEVVFGPTFADSIRDGLYQMLDAELLGRLQQPSARSLYRVIQAHRVRRDGSLADELSISLGQWARACGIEDQRADNAKRVLLLAQSHLEAEGYLKESSIRGRGFQATVTYRFNSKPQPELAALLIERGVNRPVAESLASDYPERIHKAIRAVEERISEGWRAKKPYAAIVDAVKEPVKWGYLAIAPAEAVKRPAKQRAKPEGAEPAAPPLREAVDALIRVRLGRPLSPLAKMTFDELGDEQLPALFDAAKKPAKEALPLIQAMLNAPL